MTPIQQRLLLMLQEIVQICTQHGIRYYAAGGTALGAIRHNGFIPWDDDVDLMMPRDDWKRFVQVAREGLPPNRVLACRELYDDYPHVFGRYTDTTTCAIHYNQFLGGTPEGLVIDIFIMDPVADANESFAEHREALALYNDLANPLGYSYPMSQSAVELKRCERRMRAEGRAPVLNELEQRLQRCGESEGEYWVMRWAAAPRLMPRSWFAYPREEKFEHLSISVPALLNDYLAYHYGDDWAQLPADSARLTHDAITFTDVSYQRVLDDYLPFIDVDRTKKAILKRRQYHIDHMRELQRADDLQAQILATFARLAVERGASNDTPDNRYAAYYQLQTSAKLEGREEYLAIGRYYSPVIVDLPEADFRAAVKNLADTNRLGLAVRVLKARKRAAGALPPEARAVQDYCDAIQLPWSLYDIGCHDEAVELSRYLLGRFPENFSNRLFLLQALSRAGKWAELQSVAVEGLELFPNSGEFMQFKAESLRMTATNGRERQEAHDLTVEALGATANAFIRRAAAETASASTHEAETTAKAEKNDTHAIPPATDVDEGAVPSATDVDAHATPFMQAVPGPGDDQALRKAGEHALALLCEAADRCAEGGIPCYLGPLSCSIALSCEPGAIPSPELDLLVHAGHMPRVARLLNEGANTNRTLDCWLTNGRYPAFAIDYVDTATTFLQLDKGTDVGAPGVRVRILPLRSRNGRNGADATSSLERGWELNGYALAKSLNKRKAIDAAKARAYMTPFRAWAAKRLFSRLSESPELDISPAASADGELCVRMPGKGLRTCAQSLFPAGATLQLGGRQFPSPADPAQLCASLYGDDWRERTADVLREYRNALICGDLPYGCLLQELENRGCPPRKLYALMRKIRLGMLPLANDLRTRNRAMHLAERSRDRKVHCDNLNRQQATIDELLDQGDYEELGRIYAGYEKDAKRYLSWNMGLCPSKRHLDTLCLLLRQKGESATAEKLQRLAPPQHHAPLS